MEKVAGREEKPSSWGADDRKDHRYFYLIHRISKHYLMEDRAFAKVQERSAIFKTQDLGRLIVRVGRQEIYPRRKDDGGSGPCPPQACVG